MRIFDTHCHIADPAFDADRAEVLRRMREAGVCRANVVADPCEEEPNQEKVFAIVEAHDFLVASVGVHPHNARRYGAAAEEALLRYLNHPACRLLGEIGLDYHYDFSPREDQRRAFDRQLDLAFEKNMPVQLHIREAHGDCMELLRARATAGRMPIGIMHCYTGSWEAAKVYLDLGLYISLSGALTFKNAPKLQEVARKLPQERILIETDCPYMAPTPLRGRRNEPAFITNTLSCLAALRGVGPEQMAEALYANSLRALNVRDDREN